ncbi:hypothetical protein KI688_008905 [Linnemannia hyalina]|uniref:Uncharacterized protein n=1 Tax=Linnemannia hyalina TaxID=64524 RepID=A0A9P7XI03_9FUNG|nr:hypothetical protein KI688_008905 [Linnemannia hyalina]
MRIRTMTLRNGKAVAREGAAETSSAAVVETAMESMSLATGGSSGPEGSESMEVDEETQATPAMNQSASSGVTIDTARAQVRNLGARLNALMSEQAGMELRMELHQEGGSVEDKVQLALFERDAEKLAIQVKKWTGMVNLMQLGETAMATTTPVGMQATSSTVLSAHRDDTLDDKSVVLNSLMPRYHRKVPDHEMPKIDRKYSGPVRTNVRMFLHEFKTQGNLSYGSKVFAVVCYRLLALANMDQKVRDKWDELREKAKGDRWSWDKCEQVFVECALSIHEKQTEVEDFARQGREKGESYAEFAARLRRLVEVYRVRELAKQSDVVTALKMSIPSLAMTVMQQGLIIKLLLEHVGMDVPDTNSVDFLMEAIPTALGPDDCMEWKAFIEGSKKARVLREADETKTNQVKQHQQQQQKQAVSGQVSGGAATSNATMSSATPAQHYQQGQPNGRGGGRGRGRGRFSHPYRGKIKYGAVGVIKEGVVDCALGAYEVEDDKDGLSFEEYTLVNNPMMTLYDGYPLFEFGDGDFAIVQKTYGSARRKNQPDNRLFIPVKIHGDQHLALIDTGATHSFISARIVSQYAIPVNKMTGCIELADSSTIQRVGETENVEVVCGSNLLCAPYEVIDQQHALTIAYLGVSDSSASSRTSLS